MALFQKKKPPSTEKKPSLVEESGIFKKKPGSPDKNDDIKDEINSLSRKMRLMEDRYSSLQKKSTLSEQNLISANKKFNNEIKAFNEEVLELRKLVDELDNKLLLIIKELKMCGKKDEIELLKRYINLWEPVNFVTRNEVEKIIEEKLEGWDLSEKSNKENDN